MRKAYVTSTRRGRTVDACEYREREKARKARIMCIERLSPRGMEGVELENTISGKSSRGVQGPARI